MVHEAENRLLVLKFNLALLRMDIDVNRLRRHMDVQRDDGIAVFRQERMVRIVNRFRHRRILDDAPIHQDRLPVAARFQKRRLGNETFDERDVRFLADIQHFPGDVHAVKRRQHIQKPPVSRRFQCRPPVMDKAKGNIRIRHRKFPDHLRDARGLRALRFEKFFPRGHIIEKIRHANRRPHRCAGRRDFLDVSALDLQDGRALRFLCARRHRHFGYAGDTGQRLSAKTERRDVINLVDAPDFARRMAHDRQLCILRRHPAAIVGDTHGCDAAALDFDLNLRRARIDCIFRELFDGIHRTLDDFAGGNLIRRDFVQNMNFRHQCVSFASRLS